MWAAAGVLFAALAGFLIWAMFFAKDISGFVASLGPWGPVFIILFHVAQIVLAPVPGHVIPLTAGYLYGFFWGGLYDATGMVVGSITAFFLARRFGRPVVLRFIKAETLEKAENYIAGKRLSLVFLAFALPGLPKDAMCYAAGILRVPWWAFLTIIIAIRVPADLFVILWGGGFRFFDTRTLIIGGVASAVGIGLVWLLGLWAKRRWFDR